ncbi:AbrB/MazE/SpoVT family DNA-binding domain-containing protein [Candidatus Riflebacteria bacterium]
MKSNIDMTKLSSRGQVVIPGDIRDSMGLETGTKFLVFAEGDTVILKKVGPPSEKQIKKLLDKTRKLAKKAGIKKEDVKKAIREVRKRKK